MEIDQFCKRYDLGEVLSIKKMLGGKMHQLFQVQTTIGLYAIKVFNPV